MSEQPDEITTDEERLWDATTRESPHALDTMEMINQGVKTKRADGLYHAFMKWYAEDPVGFVKEKVRLETEYQKQIRSANERDRRLAEQAAEVRELKAALAAVVTSVTPGADDPAEENLLQLIDRLRGEYDRAE